MKRLIFPLLSVAAIVCLFALLAAEVLPLGGNGSGTGHGGAPNGGSSVEVIDPGVVRPDTSDAEEQESIYTRQGDLLYFGKYPQTEVKDATLTGLLGIAAGTPPTRYQNGSWKAYEQYGTTDGNMWYIDVRYDGIRYRGVYFTEYRPYDTGSRGSASNSYQDDNGYKTNTVYWFRYEPIAWRILEEENGTALLLADLILDSQAYYHDADGLRTVDGRLVYPNDYGESDIRRWLNTSFFETAFNADRRAAVETEIVGNGGDTTASADNAYACSDTQDKVFLLSYQDCIDGGYGFRADAFSGDPSRQRGSTDYARSQGVYAETDSTARGNGHWWLRSPDRYQSSCADIVRSKGDCLEARSVSFAGGGVVPALRIRL